MSVLDKVRRWIDGETAELVLDNAARDAQVKPRSKAEKFIVSIAQEVEAVMQNEMVPLPQGTTIIPSEYTIFLNSEDDKEWQGVKRRGLEQGLYHILAERAKEIAGKKKLETKSFVLELRVDGTLEKGNVRVQHSWEESGGSKTGIVARPKPASPPVQSPPSTVRPLPSPQSVRLPAEPPQHSATPTSPNFAKPSVRMPSYVPPTTEQPPPTIPISRIQQAVPLAEDEGEELTNVRRRVTELYRLEIWLNGVRQNVVPIFQNEISIGRGSKSKPVDIALAGDAEISRRHLTLITDGLGKFWAVNEGRNAASLNNYELPIGQRVQLAPGASLAVCSYILRIQPK